ncbi:signal peptidase II [Helicobacter heilmannii]|uniref:signal peptidase II n=1 Tax=Helicobacter heilmannii TaxID=35817 RepID=UPI0006A21023|nr:signal peptidase II [Helicobacter heilmannii]CRF46390.1 Lipoprotein signal peptidase [Helicobacter heilmannii]CRF47131.1 Lipoprotein signal peptidase [Helicobacter heilmannii]CRF50738.1 Lipoprotein signal peptidase [Helicobacter heilmannii]
MTPALKFGLAFGLAVIADQIVKQFILHGVRYEGPVISIVLAYNEGVAFSMLHFLGAWLKYLQVVLLAGLGVLLWRQKALFQENALPFGLILGAGASNVLDRFVHGHVIDYVYWHYKFDFAIFNLADVLIDVGVGLLILKSFKAKDKQSKV